MLVSDQTPSQEYFQKVKSIQGLEETLEKLGVSPESDPATAVSLIEFILEGLHAQKKLSRNQERGYFREAAEKDEELLGDYPLPTRSFN